jgi:hypothetical protein
MTTPLTASGSARHSVRHLLIEQQSGHHRELALPPLLRTPAIIVLWALMLTTAVVALTLGHIQVPRIERGVVRGGPGADSLTPFLVLPSSAGRYVVVGQLAAVDTGGLTPLRLTITAPAGVRVGESRANWASIDTTTVALRLERCHRGHCLPRSRPWRFSATATLGTRSLASFALPRS